LLFVGNFMVAFFSCQRIPPAHIIKTHDTVIIKW
jgi:hypothetical protein